MRAARPSAPLGKPARPPRPAPMAARTGAASPTPLPDVPLGVQRVEVTATVVFALGAGRP